MMEAIIRDNFIKKLKPLAFYSNKSYLYLLNPIERIAILTVLICKN